MTFGYRLRNARKAGGYTQRELAQRIGAKHNSVSNWENDQNHPDPEMLRRLCRALHVTADYLLNGQTAAKADSTKSAGATEEERSLLEKFRAVSTSARAAVTALLDHYVAVDVVEAPRLAHIHATQPAPVLELIPGLLSTQSVAAGTGTYLDPDVFETVQLVKNELTSRAAFYVPVAGNSMEPRFHDGDILMIEKAVVRRGDIGIFTLDGSGFVKQLGDRELLSLNPDYEPIPVNDSIVCNGKVIGVLDPGWLIQE